MAALLALLPPQRRSAPPAPPYSQVWIHGGGYNSGSSNTYTPDTLVRQSDDSVVVVTLNYRLNVSLAPTLHYRVYIQGMARRSLFILSIGLPLSAHITLHSLVFKLPPSPSL